MEREFVKIGVILCLLAMLILAYITVKNKETNLKGNHTSIKQGISVTPSPIIIIENGWELIWADDFNSTGLNVNNWSFEDWAATKNNELQYYSPNNVTVNDGRLQIIAKHENYRGRNYTSGAIHTKDKFYFLYGKVEMKAKLPAGQGIFPAFWMMPNKENTWLPEIDIVEMLGQNPTEVWMVYHRLGSNNALVSTSLKYTGENYTTNFHTFGIEWTPTAITWLLDGKEVFKTTEHIPHEPMYLYVNTAIGGNWPGNPNNTTPFPNYFEVDYIKVYKKYGGYNG